MATSVARYSWLSELVGAMVARSVAPGVVLLEDPREPGPRDLTELSADVLDRGHEGKGQEGGPERRQPKRCAGHRVCADAARVVVGGSRDEARAEQNGGLFERALFLG